jgi:hypothetical protein
MKKFKNVTKKVSSRYTLGKGLCYFDKDDNAWMNVGWFGVNGWTIEGKGRTDKESILATLEKLRKENSLYWCDVIYDTDYDNGNGNETVIDNNENVTDLDIETRYQLFQYSWANIEKYTAKEDAE